MAGILKDGDRPTQGPGADRGFPGPGPSATMVRPAGIVFFDGDCGLCQRSIRFLARRDRAGAFRFAPLQGRTAARVLAGREPASDQDSMTVVLVDGGHVYTRSTAALRIAAQLPWPWRLLAVLRVVPRPFRDLAYDAVARHRYRWFGRADSCGPLPPVLRERLME